MNSQVQTWTALAEPRRFVARRRLRDFVLQPIQSDNGAVTGLRT